MVTAMMPVSGENLRIFFAASIPLMGVMLISSKRISGLSFRHILTVLVLSEQLPMILNRLSLLRIMAQASRISLWSSAIKILIIDDGVNGRKLRNYWIHSQPGQILRCLL